MDTYTSIMNFITKMPPFKEWPEMKSILQRSAACKPKDWRLPLLSCKAVCGSNEPAIPAASAIACMQVSIILVDDMLDSDPRGEYRKLGAPATANLAIAFESAGLEAIDQSLATSTVKLAAIRSLNQMMLTTAFGQHVDTQNPGDEAAYWQLVRTKSSPFFGAALHIGALLGGASQEAAEIIKTFGHIYGEIIQIHDDLNDTMASPANPDWIMGRSPLPILFAQVVEHPEKARFLELRRAVPDADALSSAQTILIRCGAVSYCVDQILSRHQSARALLDNISLTHREELEGLLNGVVEPVKRLFSAINGR
jgi:geranylgeranyl pyrophosphate synthase